MVIFSDRYLKTLTRTKVTHKEILKELKTYSKKHSFNYDETIYYFILKIIKAKIYFELNEVEYDEILYEAIYWASKEENRKKTRPKNAKDVKSGKDINKYIYLQKEMFKLTYETYKNEKFLADEKLIKYLTIFFELCSIKRDRR